MYSQRSQFSRAEKSAAYTSSDGSKKQTNDRHSIAIPLFVFVFVFVFVADDSILKIGTPQETTVSNNVPPI